MKSSNEVLFIDCEEMAGRNPKRKTCRIRKAHYGLKQSGRQSFKRGNQELKLFGLKQSKCDPCLYVMRNEKHTTIVAVYVDDILIASNDCASDGVLNRLKQTLSSTFRMKDLRPVSFALASSLISERTVPSLCPKPNTRRRSCLVIKWKIATLFALRSSGTN
jgi:Reverse transcriptase (RNA-dependent DNA polymerase)